MIPTNVELSSVEGAEHIELELEDLFVDDVDIDEAEPATERLLGQERGRKAPEIWAIGGLVLGLASIGVAALLLAPARRKRRFRFL